MPLRFFGAMKLTKEIIHKFKITIFSILLFTFLRNDKQLTVKCKTGNVLDNRRVEEICLKIEKVLSCKRGNRTLQT